MFTIHVHLAGPLHVHGERDRSTELLSGLTHLADQNAVILRQVHVLMTQGAMMTTRSQEVIDILTELNDTSKQVAALAGNVSDDTNRILDVLAKSGGDGISQEDAEQIRGLAASARDKGVALKSFLTELAARPDAPVPPVPTDGSARGDAPATDPAAADPTATTDAPVQG